MSGERKRATTKKKGRPAKDAEEKAGAPILVRATPAERRLIRRRADAAELSLSRYLVAVGTSDKGPPTPEEREELRRLLFELHKAGVNLNQVAARLNQMMLGGGTISTADVDAALDECREAIRAVKERMKR